MSRFRSYDDNDGEFNPFAGWVGKALSGKRTNALLHAFLDHLDAMPVKKILYEKLYEPETSTACAIGEFAKMRGMTSDELVRRAEVVQTELDNGDDEGIDCATVSAAHAVGLPRALAWQIACYNDDMTGHETVPAEGPPTSFRDYHPWYIQQRPYAHVEAEGPPLRIFSGYPVAKVEITDEKRWIRIREQVATYVAESDAAVIRTKQRRSAKAA